MHSLNQGISKVRFPKIPRAVIYKILEITGYDYTTYYRKMKVQNDTKFIKFVMDEVKKYKQMLVKSKAELRKAAIEDVFTGDADTKWKGIPEILLRLPGEEIEETKSKRLIKPLKLSDL